MSNDELLSSLAQHTGTNHYHRMYADFYLTDGARFLADNANCYWLMTLYWSHMLNIDHNQHEFTVLKLTVQNSAAFVSIEDGNDNVLAQQFVEYTDFQLPTFSLYCCWFGEGWVVMLTSEY